MDHPMKPSNPEASRTDPICGMSVSEDALAAGVLYPSLGLLLSPMIAAPMRDDGRDDVAWWGLAASLSAAFRIRGKPPPAA